MRRVLAAEAAELAEFQPLGRLLLVLRRGVVPPLAVGALENDVVPHITRYPLTQRAQRLAEKIMDTLTIRPLCNSLLISA